MPKTDVGRTKEQLIDENEALRARLAKVEDTLRAIRFGEENALVVSSPGSDQVSTLTGADRLCRELIENMGEGALTLTRDGVILYANHRFAEMLKTSLEKVIGSALDSWQPSDSRSSLHALLRESADEKRRAELTLIASDGEQISVYLSVNRLFANESADTYCAVVTDLTERKQAEEYLRLSEGLLRLVTDNLPAYVAYVSASDLCYQFVNHQYEISFQRPREQIIGQPVSSLLSQANFEFAWPYIERALKGEACSYENTFPLSQGTRWVHVNFVPRFDQSGKVCGIVILSYDITERKQSEDALEASQSLYRLLAENSSDAVTMIDREGNVVYASPSCTRRLGYDENDLLQLDTPGILRLIHPDDRAATAAEITRGRELKLPISRYEYRMRTRTGDYIWLEDILHREFDEHGRFVRTIVNSRDITDRKHTEEALSEAKQRFQNMFERHQAIMLLIEPYSGEIVDANKAASQFYGYPLDELRRLNIDAINTLQPEMVAIERERALTEQRNYLIFPHRLASGDIRTVEVHSTPIAVGGQQVLFSIIHDITARIQAEEALRESEEKWRSLFEFLPIGISIVGANHLVSDVNPALCQILGLSKEALLKGEYKARRYFRSDHTLMSPEEFPSIRAVKEQKVVRNVEIGVEKEDGAVIWTSVSATPLSSGFASATVTADITERKHAEDEHARLQAQLAQVQKMELVGRLAGGVAHEFNNMLAVIMLRTEMLLQAADPATPLHRSLTTIYDVVQRSAELVRSLLGYARKQMILPRVLNLNDTVQSSLPMLRTLIGEDIEMVWQPGAHLWPVKIDPSQFDQILINLCVNARDAIAGVGAITIETKNLALSRAVDINGLAIPSGDYMLLAMSDTGCGIDQGMLAHIFEPFFTTKEVGKGTGLGLAVVDGVVQQNGGHIQVFSEPDVGTTFNIYLPRFFEPVAETVQSRSSAFPRGNGETVLLVEDDTIVLEMATDVLQFLGYAVIPVAAPDEAIHQIEHHAGTVDLLMTDIVMPTMNGGELAERIAAIQPGIKSLFVSGYSADFVAQRGILGSDADFLQKPYSLQELAAKVRDVLRAST